MKTHNRKRSALLTVGVVLIGLSLACVVWVRKEQRQYVLNRQLIAALVKQDVARALVLVEAGADPNTRYEPSKQLLNDLWNHLLHWPSPTNDSPTALAIACGAPWNAEKKDILAQRQGADAPQLIEAMLKHGANANARATHYLTLLPVKYRLTPLLCALHAHRPISVRLLVQYGAEVNGRDNNGWTPLMYAVGSADTVLFLIERGAEVNAENKDGSTFLMMAVENGDRHTLRLLVEHGAEVNPQNQKGETALMLASECGDLYAVRLLLEQGANVNAQSKDGLTALYWAVWQSFKFDGDRQEDKDIIRQLMAQGADPNLLTKKGDTALQFAQKRTPYLVALLRQYSKRH